jgi:uncharacterized cupredoxin-like copper-binding protein
MRSHLSRRLVAAAAVAASTLGAAACGGGSSAAPATVEQGQTVTVVGTEMAFDPADVEIDAGTYRFVLDNRGRVFHELAIEGEDGSFHGRAMAGPGTVGSFVAELDEGTYEIVCRELGHYEAGMRGELTVNDAGAR